MAGNSIGDLFRLTTFGESHSAAIGGIVDGCPSNILIDIDFINKELIRRKPKYDSFETPRIENDEVEFLSGILNKKTLGTPIGFIIRNKDQKESDYVKYKDIFRPSHADYTYEIKYGLRDYRGGGRASGRETASRVVGGALAKLFLKLKNISCIAYVSQIGKINFAQSSLCFLEDEIEKSPVRCPHQPTSDLMLKELKIAKENGDTLGGIITLIINNCPIGLGEPVFNKFHAELSKALFSIGAVKGVEFGDGFEIALQKGSESNDIFYKDDSTLKKGIDKIKIKTNHSGGILGGISNGKEIIARIAFKPVPTLAMYQEYINVDGETNKFNFGGRHDVCIVPRAVPVVEAMAAIIIADTLLKFQAYK